MDEYISLQQMASKLNRSTKTFSKYVRAYEIPHIKLGREMLFDAEEVFAHLKERSARTTRDPQPKPRRRVVHAPAERTSEFAGILTSH